MDHLPRGLLARAEFYRVTAALEKAEWDLDEAFSNAARGGMGLHLGDCHLEYARLFMSLRGRSSKQSPDQEGIALLQGVLLAMTSEELKEKARKHLATAKQMIAKMGYHRRDKEVGEIESSLRGTAPVE